jgi:hypothetical protein
MPKLNIISINSFKEYVSFFEDLHAKVLWFRGCGKTSYKLIPSLYRHKNSATIEDMMKLENYLISRFQQRSIPFHTRTFSNLWEWSFFMQHFGVPTRLLDWTESPLMALFFAVTLSKHKLGKRGKPVFDNDAAVWVLDPILWNKHAVGLSSFKGKVMTTDDPNASAYRPIGDCNVMKDFPIAIYGAHNSQRIVAQRGVFVCFGKDIRPMDDIYEKGAFPKDCLTKLKISKSKLPHFFDALHRHGINDSVVFPDLDGLAREIKREFKFEV